MASKSARASRVPNASRTDRHFVQGVQRAFAGLKTCSEEYPKQTITDVAARTGLARAVARRYLLTLMELEYIAQKGPHFSLTPKVLDLVCLFVDDERRDDRASSDGDRG